MKRLLFRGYVAPLELQKILISKFIEAVNADLGRNE